MHIDLVTNLQNLSNSGLFNKFESRGHNDIDPRFNYMYAFVADNTHIQLVTNICSDHIMIKMTLYTYLVYETFTSISNTHIYTVNMDGEFTTSITGEPNDIHNAIGGKIVKYIIKQN